MEPTYSQNIRTIELGHHSPSGMAAQLNNWLQENRYMILDIKYSIIELNESCNYYSALVIYQETI